jgi:hypothetical protein
MSALSNSRHEAFAQAVASGKTLTAAYSEVFGRTGKSAHECASKLSRSDKVQARVAELRAAVNVTKAAAEAQAAAEVASAFRGALMDMAERRAFLAAVVRTPVSEVDEHSPLCQKYEVTEAGTKVWMPDKRACVLDDARLAGELIEKTEVKDVTPRESLDELRERVALARARHQAIAL